MARPIKLEFNKRRLAGFTGNQLKLIACIFMLCDHAGFMLIENGMLYAQNPMYWLQAVGSPEGHKWYMVARALRFLGRISFPMIAFLAAEGAANTLNIRKYIRRLFICAVISEIPFDLARKGLPSEFEFTGIGGFFSYVFHMEVQYADYQNVIFTILLAVCCIACMKLCRKLPFIVYMPIIAVFGIAAEYIKCDYGAMGVVLIAAFYLLRNEKAIQLIFGGVMSAMESYDYFGVSALSCIFLFFYNGKRGADGLKYFFYVFYPAHLIVFFLLVYLANRG